MKPNRVSHSLSLAWTILMGIGASLLANEPAPTADSVAGTFSNACQELMTVNVFAFGGVGFAGTISQGEKAFRTLAADPDAVRLFRGILTHGSLAGRLYALCGIRQLAPNDFPALAKHAPSGTVMRMTGCLAMEEKVSNLIAAIARGEFDVFSRSRFVEVKVTPRPGGDIPAKAAAPKSYRRGAK
jgi:hypothetical protein